MLPAQVAQYSSVRDAARIFHLSTCSGRKQRIRNGLRIMEHLAKLKPLFHRNVSLRTPDIAKALRVSQKEADQIMEGLIHELDLVTCTVFKNGQKYIEYREVGSTG